MPEKNKCNVGNQVPDSLWKEYQRAFGFLAFILNNVPNEAIVHQLRNIFCHPERTPFQKNTPCAYSIMADYFNNHLETPFKEVVQELAVDWTRLFRGVNPSYGPPPPYEGVYRTKDGFGIDIISELNKEYLKYGLASKEKYGRSDYLGYEMELLSCLAERAAIAKEQCIIEQEDEYRNSICTFINNHLLNWVSHFCLQASKKAQSQFFLGYLSLLDDTIKEIASDFKK
jgi:TorA maturation chaperone TorD